MITVKAILMPAEQMSKNGRYSHEKQHNGVDKKTAKDCSQNKRKKTKPGKNFWMKKSKSFIGGRATTHSIRIEFSRSLVLEFATTEL